MKILITQETDWMKRNPIQQHHLAELLSLRGHEIRVIDYELQWMGKKNFWRNFGRYQKRAVFRKLEPKIYKDARVNIVRPGILRIPYFDNLSLFFSHRREIKRQINEFQPDVIVGFGIINSYLAAKAVENTKIPFIYYWVDVLHRLIPTRLFQPFGVMFERMALKRSDVILVINEGLREVVAGLGAPASRTRILRTGIDAARFTPVNADDALKSRLGLQDTDTVLFFMGWLYKFSGLKEVARELAGTENNIKLVVVGEGDAYDDLQKIEEENHLQGRLILTGKKLYKDIPGYISLANVCILPAYPDEKIMRDIVPIKLYEYMAMQKPVISTRLPGVMKEFGEDNGVVYVDRPEDVVWKTREIAGSGNLKELGLKARKFVADNTWEKITDEFESILQEAIDRRKNPA
jgi:glycosyltransferase involved in cell wall biosynthesis